jgi:hypothetical protein
MVQNPGATSRDARKPRPSRHAIRIRALLETGRKRRLVEITNYSQHGLSLDRAAGIEPDERVTVELLSGLRLPMRVVWMRDGEAGLRFLGPIAPGQTVMRLLDQAARNYKLRHQAKPSQHLRSG